jgi:hypothetical protein
LLDPVLSDELSAHAAMIAAGFRKRSERPQRCPATARSPCPTPTLSIVREQCGRRGRYTGDKLVAEHGDAKLTDLLVTLANCEKARSVRVHDRCKAEFEGFSFMSILPVKAAIDPPVRPEPQRGKTEVCLGPDSTTQKRQLP